MIFITYSDDFPVPDNSEFYLVFEGKSQRHVTTAQQINAFTLRAVVPGKKQCLYACITTNHGCNGSDTVKPPVVTITWKQPPLLRDQFSKILKVSKSNHDIWNLL